VLRARWRLGGELLLLGVFCLIYEVIGQNMVAERQVALAHSLRLIDLETSLGLFHERSVQAAFLHVPGLAHVFNLYYGGTHFLIPAFALGWLALRHREQYARARTALTAATGLAFVCFWLFPLAPPRLLPPRFGIIDTLVTLGKPGHIADSIMDSAAAIYASMPSLHVAWAVWCTLVLYPVVRRRAIRILLVGYPLLTTLVVVTTGNHFFLDAIAGALLATLIWLACDRLVYPVLAPRLLAAHQVRAARRVLRRMAGRAPVPAQRRPAGQHGRPPQRCGSRASRE
jgi:hypothetical protein